MINGNVSQGRLYGLSAEFTSGEDLLAAAKAAREGGYKDIKAYSPFEVHGLADVLAHKSPLLPWLLLAGLLAGALGAFALQYWTSAIHYPLNVGGRPLVPWPAFIPIMFEAAILGAALVTVGFMFIRTGLPQPYHPIFNTSGIEAASSSRFFLVIRVDDQHFHLKETWQFLQSLDPAKVSEVRC